MRCQVSGCKNLGVKANTKSGIFLGINLENIMVWNCGHHSKEEINEALEMAGEKMARTVQETNPFLEVQKICHKIA